MEWIETLNSSNVARFAYDESNQVLKVEFKNGAIYDYYDIPENVFHSSNSDLRTSIWKKFDSKTFHRPARLR